MAVQWIIIIVLSRGHQASITGICPRDSRNVGVSHEISIFFFPSVSYKSIFHSRWLNDGFHLSVWCPGIRGLVRYLKKLFPGEKSQSVTGSSLLSRNGLNWLEEGWVVKG